MKALEAEPDDPPRPSPSAVLEAFRVRMYRSIVDSGRVPVFPLTALVGRESSGKTALLHALRGVAAGSAEPYALERDWPRERRHLRSAAHVPCTADLRLSPEALARLGRRVALAPDVRGLRVGRSYGGELVVQPWNGEPEDERVEAGRPEEGDHAALAAFALEHLPAFLYLDRDELLEGAYPLDDLFAGRVRGESAHSLRVLLEGEGATAEELASGRAHAPVHELGRRLRASLERSGRPHDVDLELERGRLRLLGRAAGRRTPVERLPGPVRYRLTLDVCLAAAGATRGSVLLLEAPGRSFRGRLRVRMRAALQRYAESGATVLYTARLPFELDLQHADQVLVLAPPSPGPIAARDLGLRAALGMTGRSSFRVDDVNLVVEGRTDALVLSELDALLRRSGEPGLPEGMTVSSAGGSHDVVSVASFLARLGLDVVALLDSDEAGEAARAGLAAAALNDPRLARVELLFLGEAAGLPPGDAALEDLLTPDLYLRVARSVAGRGAEPALRGFHAGGGELAARLERRFRSLGLRFPKTEIAAAIGEHLRSLPTASELPPELARRARRLLGSIRDATERLRASRRG